MKQIRMLLLFAVFISAANTSRAQAPQTARVVDLKANELVKAKPGTVFREGPDCPEMIVIPAGPFTMGSPASEKVWATKHGASPQSVSDEAPQHRVTVQSFGLGKYDVTRAEYAVFVRETGHPLGDGCGKDSFKWNKQPEIKDVRIAGERAFEWGYISYKDSSNPKPMQGKVLRVMK